MEVHISTSVITIRLFEDIKTFENRGKYFGIVTGYVMSKDEIFLTGAHGLVGHKNVLKVFSKLKARGFNTVWMERSGVVKRHNI